MFTVQENRRQVFDCTHTFTKAPLTRYNRLYRVNGVQQHQTLKRYNKTVIDARLRPGSVRNFLPLYTTTVKQRGAPWRIR